jgi:hypothetical protein
MKRTPEEWEVWIAEFFQSLGIEMKTDANGELVYDKDGCIVFTDKHGNVVVFND